LGVATAVFDVGRFKLLDTGLKRHAANSFPADVGNTVNLARVERKTMAAIIDLEIQRIGIALRIFADAKPHHLRAILTPCVQVRGFEAHVADSDDVHVIHLFVLVRDETVSRWLDRQ